MMQKLIPMEKASIFNSGFTKAGIIEVRYL